MIKLVVTELFMSFFIGSVPLIIWHSNNTQPLMSNLTLLNPSYPVIIYLVSLFIINIFVYYMDTSRLNLPEKISNKINDAHQLTHQIGFGIHSIYRAITGALPVAILILLVNTEENIIVSAIAISIMFFICTLLASCFFSWISLSTKPREKFI